MVQICQCFKRCHQFFQLCYSGRDKTLYNNARIVIIQLASSARCSTLPVLQDRPCLLWTVTSSGSFVKKCVPALRQTSFRVDCIR